MKTQPLKPSYFTPPLQPEKILSNIILWMYLNDGQFDSSVEWREAFVKYLAKQLGVEKFGELDD